MDELEAFIRAAKAQGAGDEFLVAMLREKGWPAREIYEVLSRHYSEAAGVVVPEPPSRLESARESFFHLLAFATLGTWVFAIGSIWFELVAIWFPDAVTDTPYQDWSIRRVSWQMASIIVAFPAFFWATQSILKDLAKNPDKAESEPRRWLTNIALLITALIFIGDLVSFVTSFLEGELTVRFVLRSLVVVLLAGAVFLYYSRGLGKSTRLPPVAWHRIFALGSAAVIVVSIGLGFWLTGSPAFQRGVSADRQRTRHLYELASAVARQHQRVPPVNLADIAAGRRDPATGQPYEYRVTGDSGFELCAQFEAATRAYGRGTGSQFWGHPAGRHCYVFQTTGEPPLPDIVYARPF